MNRLSVAFVVLVAVVLSACAALPRVSSWDGPPRFTKAEVFNAGMQAGPQSGMQTTASDRESGTLSFTRLIGDGPRWVETIAETQQIILPYNGSNRFKRGG